MSSIGIGIGIPDDLLKSLGAAPPPVGVDNLLQENGDNLLLESGDLILLES